MGFLLYLLLVVLITDAVRLVHFRMQFPHRNKAKDGEYK